MLINYLVFMHDAIVMQMRLSDRLNAASATQSPLSIQQRAHQKQQQKAHTAHSKYKFI